MNICFHLNYCPFPFLKDGMTYAMFLVFGLYLSFDKLFVALQVDEHLFLHMHLIIDTAVREIEVVYFLNKFYA